MDLLTWDIFGLEVLILLILQVDSFISLAVSFRIGIFHMSTCAFWCHLSYLAIRNIVKLPFLYG